MGPKKEKGGKGGGDKGGKGGDKGGKGRDKINLMIKNSWKCQIAWNWKFRENAK